MLRFLLLILLWLPLPAQALLHYQGENALFEDTVWDEEVLIDGILTVAMGTTLEIRPGTVVRFTRQDTNLDQIGEHELFIQGRLLAVGTAEQPIIFTSAEQAPRLADWGAINIMLSEGPANRLEHCLVEYAYRGFHAHFSNAELRHSRFRRNQRGAQFQESQVLIEGCSFTGNFNGLQFRDSKVQLIGSRIVGNNWGVRAVYVELLLQDSLIAENRSNGVSLRDSNCRLENNQIRGNRRGIYLQRSRGTAVQNRLESNLEHGIYLEDSLLHMQLNRIADNGRAGIKVFASGGEVTGNQFVGNHQLSLVNDGVEDFRLGENSFASAPRILDQQLRPDVGRIILPAAIGQE